jgi:hypothetical protein
MKLSENLKARLKELKSREDLIFTKYTIGKKANAKTLSQFQNTLPEDVLDFYEEINGCSISWVFLFEKQHRAHLHIPKLQHLISRKANQLYIANLQLEYIEIDLIEIDCHQNEGVVYLDPKSQNIFMANHTKKNGLTFLAENFTSYVEKGLEYGFGWYWMEASEEAKNTKKRLSQAPISPPELIHGVRILVVSEMFDKAFHSPGTIIKKVEKHFLVALDYGAKFWFTRDEIQHFDFNHPYEVCKNEIRSNPRMEKMLELIVAYLADTQIAYGGNARPKKEIPIFLNKKSFLISGLLSDLRFQKRINLITVLLEYCLKNGIYNLFIIVSGTLFLVLQEQAIAIQNNKLSNLLEPADFEKLIRLTVEIDQSVLEKIQFDTILDDFQVYNSFFESIFKQDKLVIDDHLAGLKPQSKSEQLMHLKYKDDNVIHWK